MRSKRQFSAIDVAVRRVTVKIGGVVRRPNHQKVFAVADFSLNVETADRAQFKATIFAVQPQFRAIPRRGDFEASWKPSSPLEGCLILK